MAATADKFSSDTFNDKDSGNTKQVYAYIPLALTAYKNEPNNPNEAVATSDASFMLKFFCHDVWKFKDSQGKDCVVGLLNPAQTGVIDYNQLHAGLRKGKLRKYQNGNEYIVLNDGGLNTKPFCEFSGGIIAAYTNYIKILCNLRSAFYLPTNYFKVTMTWTHNGNAQSYDWYVVFGTDYQPTTMLGESKVLNRYPIVLNTEVGFLSAGDQITLKIEANNEECNHTGESNYVNHQSNWKTATVLGAMRFIQVYWFSDDNGWYPTTSTIPTSGTPYAMRISEDMYASGGEFAQLFALSPDSWLNGQSPLQGCQGLAEDAYDSTISDLPNGWYYGVPKESINGSTLVYVRVDNGSSRIMWMANSYSEPNFTIQLYIRGSYDTSNQQYLIYVDAEATGTLPSGGATVYTELHELSITPNTGTRLATYSGTLTNSNHSLRLNSSSPYRCTGLNSFMTANSTSSPATADNNGKPHEATPFSTADIDIRG